MASLFSFRSLRLVPIDGAGAPRCCRPPYEGFRPLLGCSSNRDGRRIFTDGLSESRHGSGTYAGRWSLVEARKANAEALRFARDRRRFLTTRSGMVTEEEGLAGPEAANILRGLPTYHVKEKDLEKNFLEVDPDNPTPLLEYFSALLRQGNLEPNEAQKELMSKLQVLMDDIEAFNLKSGDPFDPLTARPPSAPAPPSSANERKTGLGLLSRLWRGDRSSDGERVAALATSLDEAKEEIVPRIRPEIRGLYIYGGVGQGKTMIMDAFYDCLSI